MNVKFAGYSKSVSMVGGQIHQATDAAESPPSVPESVVHVINSGCWNTSHKSVNPSSHLPFCSFERLVSPENGTRPSSAFGSLAFPASSPQYPVHCPRRLPKWYCCCRRWSLHTVQKGNETILCRLVWDYVQNMVFKNPVILLLIRLV